MQNHQDELGKSNAFEAAAMPYRKELLRAAVFMLGNHAEAEDIVQTLYLQAWRSFHRFKLGTNCRAWLYKILFNVVAQHRRKWINQGRRREELETVVTTMPWVAAVVEQLRDEEMLEAFRHLPHQYAEVVMLADVHEFSYKEIHIHLGIPIGTVMSRLSRGRRILRHKLTHFDRCIGARSATAL